MKICISIGHGKSARGGYDSGATGGGFHEFRIARKIGKYAAEALSKYVCTADLINYDGDLYLTDRVAKVNKGGYDLALEVHLNASHGTGSEVYYKYTNTAGQALAAAISQSIAKTFGIKNRGAKVKLNDRKKDYFCFVRECKCQAVLIETVFIDTDSDRRHVETEDGQRKCGEAIASAIADKYKLTKKSTVHTDATANGIHCGDTVKVVGKKYATGQKIPEWVKLQKHTVKNIDTRTGRALLKEINSWVYLVDLTVVTSAAADIAPGSIVAIKAGATYGGLTAARGQSIPTAQLAPKKHKVSKIQVNAGVREALLGDISSWVAVKSLEVV